MVVEHQLFKSPHSEQKIWRYMDLSKYLDLITTGNLFFCRVDRFDDQFEGSYSKPSKQWMIDSNQTIEFEQFRRATSVNCWHMNDSESSAMWRLYLKSNEGIAIQSTSNRLKRAFKVENRFDHYIGMVDYIDFDTYYHDISNTLRPFLLKRKSFEHERELRVLVDLWGKEDVTMGEYGITSAVDVAELIDAIYLAPLTPLWIQKVIKACNDKFGYDFPVLSSQLDSPALY